MTDLAMKPFDDRASIYGSTALMVDAGSAAVVSVSLTEDFLRHPAQVWEIRLPRAAAPWLAVMVNEINGLAYLDHDWDSYGAQPLSEKAARFAVDLLENVRFGGPAPWVSPTNEGGLHLEWGSVAGIGLEVEVDADGGVGVLFDDNGEMLEWTTTVLGDLQLAAVLRRIADL